MANQSLLDLKTFKIRDWISIKIPTLGEYRKLKNISELVNMFTTTPSAHMIELDDMGIDFTQISDYEFFLKLFDTAFVKPQVLMTCDMSDDDKINLLSTLQIIDSNELFDCVDFNSCYIDNENGLKTIKDAEGNQIIDEFIYMQISSALCEIFNVKKYKRKPGNNTAKEYILEREREKAEMAKRRNKQLQMSDDILDGEIVALVCHPGFPYDFDSINNISIYNFYACIKQVIKKDQYDKLVTGAYSGFGTVKLDKLPEDKLNWLSWR